MTKFEPELKALYDHITSKASYLKGQVPEWDTCASRIASAHAPSRFLRILLRYVPTSCAVLQLLSLVELVWQNILASAAKGERQQTKKMTVTLGDLTK